MLKYFLPVGIDRYEHILPHLRFAARDAEVLGEQFRQLGYESEAVWSDQDFGYASNLGRDLQKHLDFLRERFAAAGGGVLVIYLAGHGATAADGSAVLFKPHGRLSDLDNVRASSYIHVQQDLIKPTAAWSAVKVLIILDNCRTALSLATEGEGIRARAPVLATGRLRANGNVGLLYAAMPGQQSFEIDSKQGGLFRLATENVLRSIVDSPRPVGARELAGLGGLETTALAQNHTATDILLAQRFDYVGDDIELLDEADCQRLRQQRKDEETIAYARAHPDNHAIWELARRTLAEDSRYKPEVIEKLQRFSATENPGPPKQRAFAMWLLTAAVVLSAGVLLYPAFMNPQEPARQPVQAQADNLDTELIEAELNTEPNAQLSLGLAYKDGKGVDQDDAEAFGWIKKAAESGLAEAQYWLGYLYHSGRGVAKDEEQAIVLYRLAAAQGVENAKKALLVLGMVETNPRPVVSTQSAPPSSQAAPGPVEPVSVLQARTDSCPVGQTLHGTNCRGAAKRLTLAEALAHARTTQGYRLPTRSEMANIEFCSTPLTASGNAHSSGLSEASACSLARQFQNGAPSGNYWTSSTSDDYPQYHIAYNTEYRTLAYYHPQERFYVTLIRNE